MNKELSNQINYDSSKKNEMQEFLDFIYKIAIQNPHLTVDSDVIYKQLMNRNLGQFEKDRFGNGLYVKDFFDRWKNEFKDKQNIYAFCDEIHWPYWFQFNYGNVYEEEYIKLYVPINTPHLYQGVNELFSFLEKEKIEHQSKVGSYARIDNVIIRLRKNDQATAKKIIDFINNNKYIKTGLNKNNPFVPTINGIGYMIEPGYSYNSEIANLVSVYINECKANKKNPNVDEFRNYIMTHSEYRSLKETFDTAYRGSDKVKGMFEQKQENDTKIYNKGQLSKEQILYNAIRETYSKYGITQVQAALVQAIYRNNYNYFTNNNNAREQLFRYVKPNDITAIIDSTLEKRYGSNCTQISKENRINEFVNIIFLSEKVSDIKKACYETLKKYGKIHLIGAINKFIILRDPSSFTRGSDKNENLREIIIKTGSDNLMTIIKQSLMLKGYDTSTLDNQEIIGMFADELSNSKTL